MLLEELQAAAEERDVWAASLNALPPQVENGSIDGKCREKAITGHMNHIKLCFRLFTGETETYFGIFVPNVKTCHRWPEQAPTHLGLVMVQICWSLNGALQQEAKWLVPVSRGDSSQRSISDSGRRWDARTETSVVTGKQATAPRSEIHCSNPVMFGLWSGCPGSPW